MSASFLRDRVASAVVLVLCGIGLAATRDMPGDAAMFPRLVIGFAGLLSAAWMASTFFHGRAPGSSGEAHKPFTENARNLGIFVVSIALYVLLIDAIGYFTATILFMLCASLALGFRRIRFTAATIALFVAFVFFVFRILFDRPLPLEFFQR
ncbi:MAG: tripartite tricarboxylate transporter TctB family protein [Rhodospirillales bacterium]|nr:tripartite tricarboxylate transporter TctB family protein [Rhodospirillales bacterium]